MHKFSVTADFQICYLGLTSERPFSSIFNYVFNFPRSCIRKCQDTNVVEKELKKLLDVYGSNDLVSLSGLRRAVCLLVGRNEMVSGEQQDSKEFIDRLLETINPMFTNLFRFEERSEYKFKINGELRNCPLCNIPIEGRIDYDKRFHGLHIPAVNSRLRVRDLLRMSLEPIENDERRCAYCCPHISSCPGTDETCRKHRYVETLDVTGFSKFIFLHLNRFERDNYGGVRKNKTEIVVDDEIVINDDTFKVAGGIYHSGEADAGHYVSVVKLGNEWILFDDSFTPKVCSIREDLRGFQIYILMYKKVSVTELHGNISFSETSSENLEQISSVKTHLEIDLDRCQK